MTQTQTPQVLLLYFFPEFLLFKEFHTSQSAEFEANQDFLFGFYVANEENILRYCLNL